MDSHRTNHFGNPIITATIGSKAPASPVGSTFSKNDLINAKTTIQNQQSIDHLYLSLDRKHRESMQASPSLVHRRQAVSPNVSVGEQETYSQNESPLLGSTITTAGSTIGLPSHYPGSANHHRINSLESSVLLEELQDFDDIFEQGQASHFQHDSLTRSQDELNERSSFIARVESADYDDEDDLQSLSRSLPTRLFTFQHRRNISDLSALSLSTPPPHVEPEKPTKSNSIMSNTSNHSSTSSTRSSPSNTTTSTRHRRSRNRALSSTEFQNSVLEQL